VTPASFAPSRIHDPALRTFIKKLRVTEDPDFTRRYPAESCSRIEVATTDGRRLSVETNYPKGHRRNPLTDQEVEGKFRGLACSALDTKGCDGVLAEIWHLDKAATLDRLFDSLVISR
jgi:2-methylcitrate dehydratase